jgi:FixJ family two-component response regulator
MVGTTALAGTFALPRFPMSMAEDNIDRPLVLIVDDDEEVRLALEELLLSVGIDARCFGSTRELLHTDLPERPGCLILDVRMPGASGLDLQQHLASNGNTRPIIFLTGHGDIAMTVQAMKAGAVDFLTKPVRDQTLLDAVTAGIEKDISLRTAARHIKKHVDRYAKLTPREREVLREMAKGRLTNRSHSISASARSPSSCIVAT